MKRGCLIAVGAGLVAVAGVYLAATIYRHLHPIAHQQPYKWDAFVRPNLHFEMKPVRDVIVEVNAAIRKSSNGAVPEAIRLDAAPARIVKVHANASLDAPMDQFIADFRTHEEELNRLGAMGFEGAPFTGVVPGNHSLWCTFGPDSQGLRWESKADALHASREISEMECRPYYVADELFARMKQQRSENRYQVGAEPIVSALIEEAGFTSWSNMLPEGPNSWGSESYYDKVFKWIPESKVILVLATPEEHAEAEKRLKEKWLWIDPKAK